MALKISNCAHLSDGTAGRDYTNCHCAPTCDNVDYEASVSSSDISDLLVRAILGRGAGRARAESGSKGIGGGSDIQKRYQAAREIRSRVDFEGMGTVLGHLEEVTEAFNQLRMVLDVDIVNGSTSVTGQLFDSIGAIVQETARSVHLFKADLFDMFQAFYNKRAVFLVDQLINSANTFVSRVTKQRSDSHFVAL